ncbi:DUF3592 domain-containing protein [Halobaculum limi]|uniref:DUF3592 domain-containing protein n=1 Tax=Halobaculum limi TaxID=3031916 RepID=UPI002405C5C7|nr:DUF3592 domain-containing protein [Halobaculum sp. YSMS11]
MSDDGLQIDGPDSLRGALLFLVVGVAVAGYGVVDYTGQSDAVADAVEVDATVTAVGVEEASTPGEGTVDYTPRVRFEYDFRGTAYTGTRLYPATIAPEYDTRSAAEDAISDIDEGDTVTAFVDPSDPDGAFLRRDTSNAPLLAVAIGGVLALFGGYTTTKRLRAR